MGFKDLYKSIDDKSKAVAADLQAKAAEKAPMIDAKIAAAKEAAANAAARANEYGKDHGLGGAGASTASTPVPSQDANQAGSSSADSSWVPPGVGQQAEGDGAGKSS
ncbi:MAG: hypothetical protein WA751_02360 [Candidatus Dormiibacterota bacterium]